ncbi:MAG: hypothetical protein ABJB85_05970 [Nitrososphaerota archaeon]
MRYILLFVVIVLFPAFSILSIQTVFAQSIEDWQTYVDPAKRFMLFYPPELHIEGKENFLSSVDLTLDNTGFAREFKITIMYNDDDASLVDHAQGLQISPEKHLLAVEDQLKPSYQVYNLGARVAHSSDLYGFPTVSNTIDYTNYLGESGRTKNILAVVNGKSSFLFSYFNSQDAFKEYLPIVNQIVKSIVILK